MDPAAYGILVANIMQYRSHFREKQIPIIAAFIQYITVTITMHPK